MATNTPNYDLVKPGVDEFYDVSIPNENMDKVDAALKTLADAIESGASEQEIADLRADLTAHLADDARHVTFIAQKNNADSYTEYPTGYSVFNVNDNNNADWGTSAGFPSRFGVVETIKTANDRVIQSFFISTSGTGWNPRFFYRQRVGSNWTEWNSVMISSDVTSERINKLPNNSMSESNILADYPRGCTTLYISSTSSAIDWPILGNYGNCRATIETKNNSVSSQQLGTQRITIFSSGGESRTLAVYTRSVNHANATGAWGAWQKILLEGDIHETPDYEEGTWTPSFRPLITPPPDTNVYSKREGKFRKSGNKVSATFEIQLSSKQISAGLSPIIISGLPFATKGEPYGVSFGVLQNIKYGTGITQITGYASGYVVFLYKNGNEIGFNQIGSDDLKDNTFISGSIEYYI